MGGVMTKEQCLTYDYCHSTDGNCSPRSSCFTDVEVDWNGCRKFSPLPPVGAHPRLFFTREDIPSIIARFTHSEIGPHLKKLLRATRDCFLKQIDLDCFPSLSENEKNDPSSRETIDQFFTSDANRNILLLGAYAYGIIYNDPDVAEKAKRYAIFYAKVILKARRLAIEEDIQVKPYSVWHNCTWDVGSQVLFGGTCYALLYDIIFNDISEDERAVMRQAITSAVRGRRPWGLGWPTRRIQSNWAGYHGDLYTLSAAVEGEEDCDTEVMTLFSDLMAHYLDYAVYDSGHPIEDAYALNLGLREGSLCFVAMARRGHNVFNHPHYKNIWTGWLPYALEPNKSGKVYGGSSGNMWCYPTSAIVAKYMFPKDMIVDHVYRHFMSEGGKSYSRLVKIQCRLPILAFALPPLPCIDETNKFEKLNLPLDFVCRDRGKVAMRSDWTESAMWLTLDARPDSFLIGHDTCSRGAFVLNVGGRNWGHCPEWKWFNHCSDYSLVLINDKGQEQKAPFAKLMDVIQQDSFTFTSADLTYAYNWKWTTWAKEGQDLSKSGFAPELNNPRDFGYNVWWAPHRLFGERDVGFVGLYVWRKRIANVYKVLRSIIMVRTQRPFAIIADNIQKDEEEHLYTWAMTTPADVEFKGFDGTEAVLTEIGDQPRHLVIRNVNEDLTDLECSFRKIEKNNDKMPKTEAANQIMFTCRSVKIEFRFLVYAIENEDTEHLETWWSEDDHLLSVRNNAADEISKVLIDYGDHGETKMLVR